MLGATVFQIATKNGRAKWTKTERCDVKEEARHRTAAVADSREGGGGSKALYIGCARQGKIRSTHKIALHARSIFQRRVNC